DRLADPDAQEPGPAEHRGERRAQLMRDHRQEMVLRPVCLPQFAPRLLQVAHYPFVSAHVAEDPDRSDDGTVGIPQTRGIERSGDDLAGGTARIEPDVAGDATFHHLAKGSDEF